MSSKLLLLALAAFGRATPIDLQVDQFASKIAPPPVLDHFVSYSIEFASFVDYAGNKSQPNNFSYNLINNIGDAQQSKPVIRVGGNTQDYYTYDANQTEAIISKFLPIEKDYPLIVTIGEKFFESFQTWAGVTYTYGLNLAGNTSLAFYTLQQTAALACKTLGNNLVAYELGNEPDLYKSSAQGDKRPPTWDEKDYVNEWQNRTRLIKGVVSKQCPQVPYSYMAPSFAGLHNQLNDITTWNDGLDDGKDISLISQHNYISGASSPGVTLAHTLLNHSMTVQSLSAYVPPEQQLTGQYKIPYIFGETNSLYNEGKPGLSNSFGAALWGVDYLLQAATLGIRRMHLHQGTNFRYQSWQPVDTANTVKGTKAPYYGNIAAAYALGDLSGGNARQVRVRALPLTASMGANPDTDVAYSITEGGNSSNVRRVVLLNLHQYNYTDAAGTGVNTAPRGNKTYSIAANGLQNGALLAVRRLAANGSDAISGITWDGYSYNYELQNGRPVRLTNVTNGETAVVRNGRATVVVPDSSAVLLSLD